MRVTQHVPNWADVDGHYADIATLDELLALPWVKSWEQGWIGSGGPRPFVGWRRKGDSLIALYGADEDKWWVVASAPESLLASLPEWRISTKGQESVDRWNRGDWKA